jgi:hypothetical protein
MGETYLVYPSTNSLWEIVDTYVVTDDSCYSIFESIEPIRELCDDYHLYIEVTIWLSEVWRSEHMIASYSV